MNHLSRDLETLLVDLGQLSSHRVATLGKIPDISPVSSQSNAIRYDPFARELLIPDIYEEEYGQSREATLFINSIIEAHENEHHRITQREHQFYLGAKLESFTAPLSAINIPRDETFQKICDVAYEANTFVERSMLMQEGRSIASQLYYLRENNINGVLEERIKDTNHKANIENFLQANIDADQYLNKLPTTHILHTHVGHAFGHWCYDQIQQRWDIDFLDYAFRFRSKGIRKHPTGPERETFFWVPADVVLTSGALTDKKVAKCDVEQQVELLHELIDQHYQERGSERVPLFEQRGRSFQDFSLANRREQNRELRRNQAHWAYGYDFHYLLPLFLTDYPGLQERQNLWTILEDMYVVSAPNGTRYLSCSDQVYSWAENTKLLKMAIQMWRLREELYIPMFRAISWYVSYKPPKVLEGARAGEIPPGTISSRSTGTNKQQYEKARENYDELVDDFNPERYQELINDLTALGEAIIDENKREVRKYISKSV